MAKINTKTFRGGSIPAWALEGYQSESANYADVVRSITSAYDNQQQRNLQEQQTRTAAELGQQNYQQALGAAQAQKAQQLSGGAAFGNIAGQQMSLGQQGIQGLTQAGMLGQGQLQKGMDIAYQDFLKQQQFPYTQASTLSNLLSGVPGQQMATVYSQQPGPSMAQQLAGLGMAGAGMYGAMN